MNIKGYIFDLDDTLYCEYDFVHSGFRAVANVIEKQSEYEADLIYGMLVEEWKVRGRGKVFNTICERLNLLLDIEQLVRIYREHEPTALSLYPDAERLLAYLEKQHIPCGIITDGDKNVQWRKIRALRLGNRIPCIVVSDDLGPDCWKPSCIPYEKVLDCLGLPPEQCVYIGDNPHKDFCTARILGMHTVRIVRSTGDHMQTRLSAAMEADRIIYSLEQFIL